MKTINSADIIDLIKTKTVVPFVQEYIGFNNLNELTEFANIIKKFKLNILFIPYNIYNYKECMFVGKKEDITKYLKYCDKSWDEKTEIGFDVNDDEIEMFSKYGLTVNEYANHLTK